MSPVPPVPAPDAVVVDEGLAGRAAELATLRRELATPGALVTVFGPGGMGKTRLSRAWLGEAAARGEDVRFVDLAPCRTADEAAGAVAEALNLPAATTGDTVAWIGRALAGRGDLGLVLDNLEQLPAAGRDLVAAWRATAPSARILATSRIRLDLPGEVVLPLGPLPEADALVVLTRRMPPGRRPPAEVAALSELVRALDGLPLALELASARLRVLAPTALLARLHQRLDLLYAAEGGRHASLREAIDWSWDLLPADLRRGLVALSVYAGPFDADDAEAVLDTTSTGALDLLEAGLDQAWIVPAEASTGGPTFAFYDAIRAYLRERLDQAPERGDVERRQRVVLVARGERTRTLEGSEGAAARAWLLRRHVTLRDAIERAITVAPEDAARLTAVAYSRGLTPREPLGVALALLDRVVAALPRSAEPAALARVLAARGHLRGLAADRTGAENDLLHAEVWASRAGDPWTVAGIRMSLGILRVAQARMEEARACFEDARERYRALGTTGRVAVCWSNLGGIEKVAGRFDAAEAAWTEALGLLDADEDPAALCRVHGNLGGLLLARGRPREAERHHARAVELARAAADPLLLGQVLGNLAMLRADEGRPGEAEVLAREAIAALVGAGVPRSEGVVRLTLATAWLDAGRTAEAREMIEQASRLLTAAGDARFRALAGFLRLLARLGDGGGEGGGVREALAVSRELLAAGDAVYARAARCVARVLGAEEATLGEDPAAARRHDDAWAGLDAALRLPAGDQRRGALEELEMAPSAEVRVVVRHALGR